MVPVRQRRNPRSQAARVSWLAVASVVAVGLAACTAQSTTTAASPSLTTSPAPSPSATIKTLPPSPSPAANPDLLAGMPAPLSPSDVYAADGPNNLSPIARTARALVYVPNTIGNTVTVIDQQTMQVIGTFPGGHEPQHVVPAYDLKTLYVAADYVPTDGGPGEGSLTPIDPVTGQPGAKIPIEDPYNLYFTANGQYAIVMAEARKRLDFYDPHSWQRVASLSVPACGGLNHLDYTADGRTLLASCEFANRVITVDVASQTLLQTITLPRVANGMPQDVKLSPDGKVFYVADLKAAGVYLLDAATRAITGFIPTGRGAHGLYVDRTSTRLFVTNRDVGSVTVIDLATRAPIATWLIPGGGSPDMGNLSADGRLLWLAGRYHNVVYVIDTTDGHLVKKIPVGAGPHGLTVWPQPGRYSLGHTGIMR